MWKTIRRVLFGESQDQICSRPEYIDLPQPLKLILKETAWSDMRSATGGDAARVPDALLDLFSRNKNQAVAAADALWNLLCHQRVRLSEAAVPAAPVIFYALEKSTEPELLGELLEVLWGFAELCDVTGWEEVPDYLEELLLVLERNRHILRALAGHEHEDVSETARIVLENLDTAKRRSWPRRGST